METGSDGARSLEEEVEVVAKAERRRFTAEYKLRVLREADQCKRPGEIGALLRREGLYWSSLSTWRRQRESGELVGLKGKRRGPKRRSYLEQNAEAVDIELTAEDLRLIDEAARRGAARPAARATRRK